MPPSAEIGPSVKTIRGAIKRMERIERDNAPHDGLRAFNSLYLDVTREVWARLRKGEFADCKFMRQLDVEFANRYFHALRKWHTGSREEVPKAWRTLLEKRANPEIYPLQFACAGVNAHINFDLSLALVETWRKGVAELGLGVQYADYNEINDIFDDLYGQFQAKFDMGFLGIFVDGPVQYFFTEISELVVERSRESAWERAKDLLAIRERGDVKAESDLLREADESAGGKANIILRDYHPGTRPRPAPMAELGNPAPG